MSTPTDVQQHKIIQTCFDFYNKNLFNSEIPELFFVFDFRIPNAMGYFSHDKFSKKSDKSSLSVISLNPTFFKDEPITILQTLVHELCHAWQRLVLDDNGTHGYHDKVWAKKMIEVGLMPSSTGKEGGKLTGKKMSDYIIPVGKFWRITDSFISENEDLFLFLSREELKKKREAAKSKNKIKYTCSCGQNAWGKPELLLICGICKSYFESYEG